MSGDKEMKCDKCDNNAVFKREWLNRDIHGKVTKMKEYICNQCFNQEYNVCLEPECAYCGKKLNIVYGDCCDDYYEHNLYCSYDCARKAYGFSRISSDKIDD